MYLLMKSIRPKRSDRGGIGKLAAMALLAAGIGLGMPAGAIANELTEQTQPRFSLFKKIKRPSQDVQIAQSDDAAFRVNQLEEQVRRLNGQVEELNFQLLQMQEMIRRMQEDNEFRFQELEGKKRGSLDLKKETDVADRVQKDKTRLGKSLSSDVAVNDRDTDVKHLKKPRMIDGVEIYEGEVSSSKEGQKEVPLGSITFDSLGNVIDTAVGKPIDLTSRQPEALDQPAVDPEEEFQALIDEAVTEKDLYALGYGYFQRGHFVKSERVFSTFTERYPDSRKMPKAKLWLGESIFAQNRYEDAAKVFLDAHTKFPDAKVAPQVLLKLGKSLAGMEQRELACATYAKVYKKYPDINNTLRKRVGDEQRSSRCLNG